MSKITDGRFTSLELALNCLREYCTSVDGTDTVSVGTLGGHEAGNVLPLSSGGLSVPLLSGAVGGCCGFTCSLVGKITHSFHQVVMAGWVGCCGLFFPPRVRKFGKNAAFCTRA